MYIYGLSEKVEIKVNIDPVCPQQAWIDFDLVETKKISMGWIMVGTIVKKMELLGN